MEQADLLRRLIESLEEMDIAYMVVGSFASSAYGEPRLTQDIDAVVALRPEQVAPLCAAFPEGEFYVSRDAAMEAVRRGGQFNVIHPATGTKIDFLIARSDAWGQAQMQRRQRVRILPDRDGYVARPEDIILGKMQYYRQGGSEKHLRDIAGILKVLDENVDRAYVARWSEELGLTEIWNAILRRLGGGGTEGAASQP